MSLLRRNNLFTIPNKFWSVCGLHERRGPTANILKCKYFEHGLRGIRVHYDEEDHHRRSRWGHGRVARGLRLPYRSRGWRRSHRRPQWSRYRFCPLTRSARRHASRSSDRSSKRCSHWGGNSATASTRAAAMRTLGTGLLRQSHLPSVLLLISRRAFLCDNGSRGKERLYSPILYIIVRGPDGRAGVGRHRRALFDELPYRLDLQTHRRHSLRYRRSYSFAT